MVKLRTLIDDQHQAQMCETHIIMWPDLHSADSGTFGHTCVACGRFFNTFSDSLSVFFLNMYSMLIKLPV